ncbi:hypothetical protein niasHT_016196 [Heterodera trifolii]|uniref:F-box domain-containing protein n=1 Tax=Heterodera trifolii TaxID=157864 RepID=A0ABD2KTZ1_9BILA
MVPKCLPLELLFEIVPFIPAEKAVPNALSSCRLLHKLLLPRVIKWKEIMSDNINFQNEIREELKKINQRITVQNQRISVLEGNCGKAGETTGKAPNAQKERGNGHKAVIGDYNENNGTIEVPFHGYNIGKMIVEGILDAESGTVVVDGMHEPISLAKAVEIGFFDNLSLTVADPNTMELLFLDKALRRKVLDSNGRLQHRQLKLSKAIEQNLVLLVKSKPTSHKKSIKLESGSPKTSIQPDKTSTESDKMPSTSITSMQPDKTSMAVIGDYNENKGTIKVPYHGYHIGQAINERILDAESGTVLLHGMREPISLAKAVEIGFFDNLSLSVADPNTLKVLFLDEALGRKVLDSNGRLQHRQLKLSEAMQQGFVHIGSRRATRDCRKKTLKLKPRSPQTSIQLDKTSNSISNKSTEPDKTSSISNYPKSDKPSNSTSDSSIQPDKTSISTSSTSNIYPKSDKPSNRTSDSSIQPDKTSISTSSTSNIYPKSDKPSDSTSDSSIQPDKTSMDFWNFTSMVTLINEAIRMNSSMERGDLLEMLCMYGPTTCENALDTPDQLESFVAEHCPSVRIESVGKGNGAKKFFHWNSADDQTWKAGLDRMAKGVQSVENPMKKAKVIKRTMEKRTDDHSSG